MRTQFIQRPTQSGFTLVEVLVALIVLSIGMLGIAALYLDTLRASRQALVRTQAVNLAGDIADRIRANRVTAGAYDCDGVCEEDEGTGVMAIDDLNAWRSAVEAQLPGGSASITYTAAVPNVPSVYNISLSWTEAGYEDPLTYQLRIEI